MTSRVFRRHDATPRSLWLRGFALCCICLAALPLAAAGFNVERVDPPHWWVGMNERQLQLQVYGHDVRDASFSVDYPGVRVDSVSRLDGSPNWQFIYLTVSPDARPGRMRLQWKDGRRKVARDYDLRPRTMTRGGRGFGSSDLLYLLMPDRFADGNPSNNVVSSMRHKADVDRSDPNVRHGGDFAGIMNHLDYIDSLGVTAVWFNPVLENDMPGGSYHGYATTDYYSVDPRFGSNEEYAVLIDSLHSRDIKTVMDMIFNHCGSGHPWLKEPPASDWFNFQDSPRMTNHRLSTVSDRYASDYDRQTATGGWFVAEMPDLNQLNPHLMKYLIQNSIWWIEEAAVDGIRMDTYPYADRVQMKRWVDAVLREYPDFNIVGECWFGSTGPESSWQKASPSAAAAGYDTGLPVVMDFPLMIASRGLQPFMEDTDSWNGLSRIYNQLALDYLYADPAAVLRFLDNHDTERVILTTPDSLARWKQAITLLLTIPGIPQIYYGTELLMSGDRKGGDGNVRRDVPGGFPGDSIDNFSRQGRTALQNEAYDFISRVAHWRRNCSAMKGSAMKHFAPDNGLYLYQRGAGADRFVVVMNGRDCTLDADMSRYEEIIGKGEEYRDALTGRTVVLRDDDDTFTFAPREILILQPFN